MNFANLSDIKGVGSAIEAKLKSLDIFCVQDLIKRLPRSYIDLDKVTPLGSAIDGDYCLLDIFIISKTKPYKGKVSSIFRAEGKCGDFLVKLNWYNSSYPSKTLEIGEVYTFYGKVKINGLVVEMNNPAFEKKGEVTKFCGILPIYSTKGIIPQGTYRALVKNALPFCYCDSVIPKIIEQKYKLMSLKDAYFYLHSPESLELKKLKERVAMEMIVRRLGGFSLAREGKIEKINFYRETDIKPLSNVMDFELNSSQEEAFLSIKKTMMGKKKLNAILCGDVGSGKTIVAIFACYFAIKNGFQAAFMAPTEILAKQHYDKIVALFDPLNIKVALLSGSTNSSLKDEIVKGLKNQTIDIVVGTHSLISEGIEFKKLGIAIADEQHRFGVAQRTKLIKKAQNCDFLTLSATPIPRSMQLIAYGEVEVLDIERRFCGNVFTKLVNKEKRADMWEYIASYCKEGGQAFVVAPQIYDSEGIESDNVISLQKEIEALAKGIKTVALHGKLKPELKEKIINDFAEKRIGILVSTTVIEVGIDVPNAGIMVIMEAERFGLATLHQLRGRIGRNGEKAYCFLYTEKKDNQNLHIMKSCVDGFALAEKDFNIRGCGELLGTEQSGTSTLNCMTLSMLKKAKKIADEIDFLPYREVLKEEIENYSLFDVSLN